MIGWHDARKAGMKAQQTRSSLFVCHKEHKRERYGRALLRGGRSLKREPTKAGLARQFSEALIIQVGKVEPSGATDEEIGCG